ncbi:MAG: hypothetical protein O3B87_02340 [bacterium]|nr:hypothetical protein [bacterium]
MDLVTITSIIAIIFMIMWIVLIAALLSLIIMIIKLVRETPQKVEEKMKEYFSSNKLEILASIGVPVATFLISRIKGMMSKK